MALLELWYLTLAWLISFVAIIGHGYSNTMFLANEGRPKSVENQEATEKDTKGIQYWSKPTLKTTSIDFWGYTKGYSEVFLTGAVYGVSCALLCLITNQNIGYSIYMGALIGGCLSLGGFIAHKIKFCTNTIDSWGLWELSAGLAVMFSIGLST